MLPNLRLLLSTGLVIIGMISMIGLQGCDNDEPPYAPRERSYLSVIQAYSGVNSIDVELESFAEKKTVAEAILFNQAWPSAGYASLLSEAGQSLGDTGVIIRLKDWRSKEQVVPDRVISLFPGIKTTVGIIDSMGKPDLIQIRDSFARPEPGFANVRFMNLTHLYPALDLVSGNDSIFLDRFNYLIVSKFVPFRAGTYDLYARHSFTERRVDSLMNVTLKPRKTYNVYITQDRGQPRMGLIELE